MTNDKKNPGNSLVVPAIIVGVIGVVGVMAGPRHCRFRLRAEKQEEVETNSNGRGEGGGRDWARGGRESREPRTINNRRSIEGERGGGGEREGQRLDALFEEDQDSSRSARKEEGRRDG